jgi:hypothetical protein
MLHTARNQKQIFPEKELRGHSPNFHIHVSVSDLYIPTTDLPILLQKICGPILGIYKSLTDTLTPTYSTNSSLLNKYQNS